MKLEINLNKKSYDILVNSLFKFRNFVLVTFKNLDLKINKDILSSLDTEFEQIIILNFNKHINQNKQNIQLIRDYFILLNDPNQYLLNLKINDEPFLTQESIKNINTTKLIKDIFKECGFDYHVEKSNVNVISNLSAEFNKIFNDEKLLSSLVSENDRIEYGFIFYWLKAIYFDFIEMYYNYLYFIKQANSDRNMIQEIKSKIDQVNEKVIDYFNHLKLN